MTINLKNKKELTFMAIGILMLLIVMAYSLYAIQFSVGKVNASLNDKKIAQSDNLRFQLEKTEVLLRK